MAAINTQRRRLIKGVGFLALSSLSPPLLAASANALSPEDRVSPIQPAGDGVAYFPDGRLGKVIPRSGELLPVIGMGTWRTFNVGDNPRLLKSRTQVLKAFYAQGGGMIDSSPMYGSAEAVLGHTMGRLKQREKVFAATKVWTSSTQQGVEQVEDSKQLWGVQRFDLFQVHNLVNWQAHLQHLLALKAKGEIRYVGITTSHGRRHHDLADIMKTQPIDFVQLTYNIVDREVEDVLLPLALEKDIAVIANRPYQGGQLMRRYQSHELPHWAAEIDCRNWAEFLLKYVVSHPAITCAIPATSQVEHMHENMGALRGSLPGENYRNEMVAYLNKL